jgi:CO/xanthine dehydrogenase FAD-binding subunit
MSKIKWYYTDSLAEASSLLRDNNVLPHGGGTNLVTRELSNIDGLLDLSKLKLNYIKQEKDTIEIGSMTTYCEVVKQLKTLSPENILIKSLQNSANTPLRNRITIGGSIGFIPKWSDLIGALMVLDANVVLIGKNVGDFPIADILKNNHLLDNSLITAIKFINKPSVSSHYRDIKTKSDMPLFTITTLIELKDKKINNPKIYITGTRELVSQITNLEKYLQNKSIEELSETDIQSLVNVTFRGNRITDPMYLSEKAKIETCRAIFRALEMN